MLNHLIGDTRIDVVLSEQSPSVTVEKTGSIYSMKGRMKFQRGQEPTLPPTGDTQHRGTD